jgi:diadenosine tetraphosphatase ApaH/serine/threonine PP2A family protein phosphatase
LKYLIFSDIHSNLEALEAVVADAAPKGIDMTICLGDFVGYGANPRECVERASMLPNFSAVLGNHDAAVIEPGHRDFFNPVAQAGIAYSERNLDDESRTFLRDLPLVIDEPHGFMAVHASPYMPEGWVYVLEPMEAADAFHVMKKPVAFIGHTHFPVVHSDAGMMAPFMPGDRVKIESDSKKIINVGSVGQPRDGDPRAAYVVFDDEAKVAEMFRVDYDIDTASDKILKAGLPPLLAHRIRRGY